ncbi:T9SS type A sorting domain-containing protein, partial [Bacteroidales bacterium OttesenSCG-928-K03]|nr:T9SS type A sorting domain-containing protein [Bacteroidales bacterium OttesenSCG-928-K03]
NEYVDEGVYYGDHEYCIRVVYVSLAMSCEGQCETVPIPYPCDPTGNLEGVNPQDTQNALISWGAEPIEEWLKYDDGINVDGIGGPSTFIWAVKFDPNQLSHLDGTSLTKISIYKYAAGTDELRIYQGNNAATLLHSQQLDGLVVSMYQDVELSSPVALDVTQQLWIAVSTTNGTTYPAGCGNYAGNPNSDLISQDGGATWEHINDMGLPYSWNLRGFVTNARGVEMAIPMEKPIDPISTESFVARGKGHYNEAPVMVTRSNDALQGYNVYRKLSTESTYTVVGNVPAVSGQMSYEFLDADLAQGTYHFQVTALYEFEDGYECESEPALTPDGSQNFVEVIIETGIDSYGAEARIYPNPASNYITIEAAKMNRITVMSMVGQVVYDVKVDSNQESVDVSSLKSGVYIVRISTESGVSTERITIVR